MAYLRSNVAFGPIELGGFTLSAGANTDFTVPDDLVDEATALIQQTPGRTVTVLGYDRPADLYVGAIPPWTTRDILTNSASAEYLIAFQVSRKVTVSRALIEIGVSAGNICAGIYSAAGGTATLIATTGSIAAPTASTASVINLTAPVTLYPGVRYYAGWAQSNATLTVRMSASNGQIFFGINADLAESGYFAPHLNPGVFPLPDTINLASCVGTGKAIAVYFLP